MKTLVLGWGVSGQAAAEFLMRRRHEVVGYDVKASGLVRSDKEPVAWEEVAQVVVSPGIPPTHPIYAEAVARGVPVVGEVGLGLPELDGVRIGITGTNGKTTVTLLLEHVFRENGVAAVALGNVGTSVCGYLNEGKTNAEVFLVELSSFQLETLQGPLLDGAAILNITPDHLDRHGSMYAYARLKCRIQHCLKPGAPLVVSEAVVREWGGLLERNVEKADATLLPFEYIPCGGHELENVSAAWLLARPLGITPEGFARALETFQKPPHRIEFVREVGGVSYFDDSKGTNLDAVVQAVRAMPGPVVLIAGGVDKGASYVAWKEWFLPKVKGIVVIGQAAPKITQELSPHFEIKQADSLSSSVQIAASMSQPGDCVLLSPGCASYDMFCDYAHRGRVFQECVQALT